MSQSSSVVATFWKESSGHCDCCGRESKSIWGDLSDAGDRRAVYFVHWTVGAPEHHPNVDLIIGRWGEAAKPTDRVLVSLEYRPGPDGSSFMVISGEGRAADDRSVCGRVLRREEVVGTPLAAEVFALVDALWLTEPRIEEVRAFNNGA